MLILSIKYPYCDICMHAATHALKLDINTTVSTNNHFVVVC